MEGWREVGTEEGTEGRGRGGWGNIHNGHQQLLSQGHTSFIAKKTSDWFFFT